jgi:hypothetical protein
MEKEKNVVIVVGIVILATMLVFPAQVVSAAMPELKLPLEPGFGWDITCCYNGDGGGVCGQTHSGKDSFAIDFNLLGEGDNGKSIRAVASGTAQAKYNKGGYGHYVDVDHGDGYISRYAHLKEGTTISGYVLRGTEVGKCGDSGLAYGSHLHFVLYRKVDGQLTPVKPEPMSGYTDFKSGGGPYYSDNYEPTSTQTSWDFNTQYDTEGWEAPNVEGRGYSVEDGGYFINPKQIDPWIRNDYVSGDASVYNAIEINMASNCPDGNGRIYFTTSNSPGYNDNKMVEFKINNDGNWRTYTIYMASHDLWRGTITGLRIDPAEHGESGREDTVGFDWIRMIYTSEKPSITYSELNFRIFSPWDTITFKYSIHNPFANKFEGVRLGAQIRTNNPQGTWIDDRTNDKVITLNSGTNRYSRIFWIPYSISTGNYDAHWVILNDKTGIWFDNRKRLNAFMILGSATSPDPTPKYLSADLNCDGIVNVVDSAILMSFWGKDPSGANSCQSPDINQDGNVNLADRAIMMSQWT